MKKRRIALAIVLLTLLTARPVELLADEDTVMYSRALRSAQSGNLDFAYMDYRILLRDYPGSRYTEYAMFAQGEYYFVMPDYVQAEKIFDAYLKKYPESKGALFALAYLLQVAEEKKDEPLTQKLKNEMLARCRVGLVFRNSKEYRYRSPMNRKLKVVFYIDKIEFYEGKKLIGAVSY